LVPPAPTCTSGVIFFIGAMHIYEI
jgi:hypothetical protein